MCYATADSLPIYSLINVFRERRPRLHRRRRRRRRERESVFNGIIIGNYR